MTDTLIIKGLAIPCRIGVTEEERAAPQTIWIDLELPIGARKAAAHDDVREAVDYARLVEVVTRRTQGQPYHLMETLADALAAVVLNAVHAPEVMIRVTKRALPSIDSATVQIVRTRP